MDVADCLIVSFLAKCVFNDHLEGLFLIVSRHRHLGTEELIDHLRLQIR